MCDWALHSGYTSVSGNCHSFMKIANAHLDLTTVLPSYATFWNIPLYLQDFASPYVAIVSLSYQYHNKYVAIHSWTVFKLLTWCNRVLFWIIHVCIQALVGGNFHKYVSFSVLTLCASITLSFIKLGSARAFWKLLFWLTVYWIYTAL